MQKVLIAWRNSKDLSYYLGLILTVTIFAAVAESIRLPDVAVVLLFILSFVVGFIVNSLTTASQYEGSTAAYRLAEVIAATNQLLKPGASSGPIRSRYRYSMAVIIDNLRDLQAQIDTGVSWPALTERHIENGETVEDGWALYDRFVRHITADISPYVFVNPKLQKLSKVCSAIETVVGTLDAAFENPALIDVKNNRVIVIAGVSVDDPRIVAMKEAYAALNVVWKDWVAFCNATED